MKKLICLMIGHKVNIPQCKINRAENLCSLNLKCHRCGKDIVYVLNKSVNDKSEDMR